MTFPDETRPVEPPSAAEVPQSSREESLFASDDLTGLRSRWDDVQAGFVDDPHKCVQTADGLASDVVQARGEDVSTEDLRLALKRYRNFFDRLVAVRPHDSAAQFTELVRNVPASR